MYYVAILVALAGTAVEAGRIVGPNGGCCLPRKMSMVEGMMLGRVVEQKGSVMLVCILSFFFSHTVKLKFKKIKDEVGEIINCC